MVEVVLKLIIGVFEVDGLQLQQRLCFDLNFTSNSPKQTLSSCKHINFNSKASVSFCHFSLTSNSVFLHLALNFLFQLLCLVLSSGGHMNVHVVKFQIEKDFLVPLY